MANVSNRLLYIQFLLLFAISIYAQKSNSVPLQEALLEIAKSRKLSLVFNPENIPNTQVQPPSHNKAINQSLDDLLEDSGLAYEIRKNQIFLFKKHKIFGYIENGTTGERLISATIYLPEVGEYGISNEYGYFNISTVKDSVLIEISHMGYKVKKKLIHSTEMDQFIVLKLIPGKDLKEVIVTDLIVSEIERKYFSFNKGSNVLLHQNIAATGVGGEPDLLQAMMRQSGVNTGTDGVGGIHIRGGKTDQNLLLYDGVKLYHSAHAFGIYSLVNSSVVDQARLYKSGSSGSLSGRLSSIMDIKIKEPDLQKNHAMIQVSTLASQATLEAPILTDKLGIMLTGRRTHIDPILKVISSREKEEKYATGNTNFYFDDFNIKMYGKLKNHGRLYLTLYSSNDSYDELTKQYNWNPDNGVVKVQDKTSFDWKNKLASIRYNFFIGNSSFANAVLSTYRYDYNSIQNNSLTDFQNNTNRKYTGFESGVRSEELKLGIETVIGKHHLKYGISGNYRFYKLGKKIYDESTGTVDTIETEPILNPQEERSFGKYRSGEVTLYLSDKYKISNRLMVDGGVYGNFVSTRKLIYYVPPSSHFLFSGYLNLLFKIKSGLYIGAIAGRYVQTEHLLSTGDYGLPNNIWVPSTEPAPPETANQAEFFVETQLRNHTIKLATFIKKQRGLVLYDTAPLLPTLNNLITANWENETSRGSATGYGFEIDYSYRKGDKYTIHATYTFGQTDILIDEANDGVKFPFDYSIPHTFVIGSNVHLNNRISASLDWYIASGKPYTLFSSTKDFSPLGQNTESGILQQSGYNDLRLPPTHKLSFSLSTFWFWGEFKNDLSIGIQNAYDRKNVIYEYEIQDSQRKKQNGFPILPVLRWRIGI